MYIYLYIHIFIYKCIYIYIYIYTYMRHITEIGPAKVARPKSNVLKTHVLVAFF